MEKQSKKSIFIDYLLITLAAIILDIGVYVFKFPNNFSFGGVTGIAVVLASGLPLSASTLNFIINMLLLAFGLIFLGKSFALRTVYASVVISVILSALEHFFPMSRTLTDQPVLELIFAIILPAASSAILFNIGASGGGTDIIAMILKKYTSIHIGTALLFVDLFIVLAACFTFNIETGLFSLCGLLAKSLVIDSVIENLNLCKYFTIVCDDPEPICDFIQNTLNRSATKFEGEGIHERHHKYIILAVMKRSQAIQLRNFIHETQPGSFIMITNSSEIIGKGFRGLN